MIKKLEKYGEVTTYKETENKISFVIIGVSHKATNTMCLFKDISDYCNWPIEHSTFEDGIFHMILKKESQNKNEKTE